MATIPFNTLNYAGALKAAGIAESAADAYAQVQAKAWGEVIDQHLVSKQDFKDLERRLTRDIQDVETKLTHDMRRMEHKMEHKIDLLGKVLLIKLGSIMVAGVAVMAGLSTALRFC